MKKIFALFLISIMLLSSCAVISNEGNAGIDSPTTTAPGTTSSEVTISKNDPLETKVPETNAPETTTPAKEEFSDVKVDFQKTDSIILTTDVVIVQTGSEMSLPSDFYKRVFYLGLNNSREYSDGCLSYEFPLSARYELKYPNQDAISKQADCRKAGIIDSNEKLSEAILNGIGEKYSEPYADDFFENNVILYISSYGFGSVFYEFEYGFDPETKLLAIHFTQPVKDTFLHSDLLHTYDYYITIPKEAITVNGKMIPYEKLNFRFTGYDDK